MSTFWCFCTLLTLFSLVNTQQISGARCQLPIDPGNCGVLAILSTPRVRYGYSITSGNCIQFTYSGCGGNTNRFSTYARCMSNCSPALVAYNQLANLATFLLTGQT